MKKAACLVLLTLPIVADANMGLPMVAVFLPPMWLALLAIVAIESFVFTRVCGVGFAKSLRPVAWGNLASTILGIPIVWSLLAATELVCCGTAKGLGTSAAKIYAVTVQAPWLIPYESEFHWMIPAAVASLFVPFFIASVVIEAPFNVRSFADIPKDKVWKATAAANLGSYVGLGLITAVFLAAEGHRGFLSEFFDPIVEWLVGTVFAVASMLGSG
jgi:hypothetical protein